MNKRKILYLLFIIVIASVIAIFGFDLLDSSVSVSYKDFRLALDSGAIESAQINPNTITINKNIPKNLKNFFILVSIRYDFNVNYTSNNELCQVFTTIYIYVYKNCDGFNSFRTFPVLT